jgi:hypothetical protein
MELLSGTPVALSAILVDVAVGGLVEEDGAGSCFYFFLKAQKKIYQYFI